MKTPTQCIDVLKSSFQFVFARPGSYGEIAYAAGVGQLETNCGEGWGTGDDIEFVNGVRINQTGSFNWGAVTGAYNGQYFEHKDSRPDGKGGTIWYVTKFRAYPTDAEGCADFLRILYCETHNNTPRENVRKAADECRFRDASAVLRASGYYSGVANVNGPDGKHDEAASIDARIDAHYHAVVNSLPGGHGRFSAIPRDYFGNV